MKKFFLFSFVVYFIAACSPTKEKEIALFNNIVFSLSEGENIEAINSKTKDVYFSYLKDKEIQPPLFKQISTNNYSLYIGIPYNVQLPQFTNSPIVGCDTTFYQFNTDSTFYCYNRYKQDSIYISEYVVNLDENLIYVLGTTVSEQIADSLFNKTRISNRITNNKK